MNSLENLKSSSIYRSGDTYKPVHAAAEARLDRIFDDLATNAIKRGLSR
jgi:hypothetical protein